MTRNAPTVPEDAVVLRVLLSSIFFLLLIPIGAQENKGAQDPNPEVLQCDRPVVIRARDLENQDQQIEIDFRVTRDRDGTPTKLRLPVLYRVDTGPDTEVRISSNFLTYQNPNLGFSDTLLGLKWNFVKGRGSWAIVGDLEFPSGSAGFADPGVIYGAILVKSPDKFNNGITRVSGALNVFHSLNPKTQLSLAMSRSFSATGDDYEFVFGWSHRY